MSKRYIYIDEEKYNSIKRKIADRGGLTTKEICSLLDINTSTFYRVNGTLDFNHYLCKYRPSDWAKELNKAKLSEEVYGTVVRGDDSKDSVSRFDKEITKQLKTLSKQNFGDTLTRNKFWQIKAAPGGPRVITNQYKISFYQYSVIKKSQTYEDAIKTLRDKPTISGKRTTQQQNAHRVGWKITEKDYEPIKYDYDHAASLSIYEIAKKYGVSRASVNRIGKTASFADFKAQKYIKGSRRKVKKEKEYPEINSHYQGVQKSIEPVEVKDVPIATEPQVEEKTTEEVKQEAQVQINVQVTIKDIKRAKGGILARLREELLGE